jgi:hypothetical protein
MHTQSDSIAILLGDVLVAVIAIAAVVEAHPAGEREFFSTLMRHVLAFTPPVAPILLACRVRELAAARPLVPPPRLAPREPPRLRRARWRAVALPSVVRAAEVEHRPADGPDAVHEAERLHGRRRGRQELDATPNPCDEPLVASTATDMRPEGTSLRLGPSLFSATGRAF